MTPRPPPITVAISAVLVQVHSLDLCQHFWPFLLVPVQPMDLYVRAHDSALTVVNKGTVVCRRNLAFSEREREEMGVPGGMTASV